LNAVTYWLALSAVVSAVAFADQPSPGSGSPTSQSASSRAAEDPSTPGDAASDDDFFEFLGADDVGDTDLWEYLKSAAPPARPPPPSSQETQP